MMFPRRTQCRPLRRPLRSSTAPRPQLTSLVDMMTILLVFLLQSFSADNEFAVAAIGIELPVSRMIAPETDISISVEVSPSEISIDGKFVLAIDRSDPASTSLTPLKLALGNVLADIRSAAPDQSPSEAGSSTAAVAAAIDTGNTASGAIAQVPSEAYDTAASKKTSVSIQCDQSHNFSLLKQIIVVCTEEGVTELSLVVDRSET